MLSDAISTAHLTLACLREEDASETYLGWLEDPEVNRFLEARFVRQSLDSVRAFVREQRASNNSALFGMFLQASGAHIGNIKVTIGKHRNASVGLLIGDKDYWGRGLATEAIRAVTDWAFDRLGLQKLTAGSYASNHGSRGAFLRIGYVVEGVQRSEVVLDTGERDDVVLLGMTRADWEANR